MTELPSRRVRSPKAESKGDKKQKPIPAHPKDATPLDITKSEADMEIKSAYRSAIRSALKEHFLAELEDDPKAVDHLPSVLADMLTEAAKKKASREKKTSEFSLVTVNCKPGTDVKELVRIAEKAACKKIVHRCVLAFEVGTGGHPHVHMAIQFYEPKAKSIIRNTWAKTFESVLAPGSYKSDRILNIAMAKDHIAHQGQETYVRGTKVDSAKMKDLEANTKPFRQANGLYDFYEYEDQQLVAYGPV